MTPYRRDPRWSSGSALKRIETKRRLFAKRREAIKLMVEDLCVQQATFSRLLDLAEARSTTGTRQSLSEKLSTVASQIEVLREEEEEIDRLEGLLALALESETVKMVQRKLRSQREPKGIPSATDRAARGTPASEGNDRVAEVIRVAGGAGAAKRYDKSLCLFRSDETDAEDDHGSRPVDPRLPWAGDQLMQRMRRVVDVPGLAHWLLLSEREYAVTDVVGVEVPAACEGLPSAPAFASHLFSADALEQLADPDGRQAFLLKVGIVEPEGSP